jgi:DNA-binding GntR family transcriptional regulator
MAASSQSRLRPVAAESIVELAYNSIRGSILAGQFKPGEHLVEAKIAKELEISRAPVREAMQRLSREGLAIEKPRRGMFVREIEGPDLVDIYNARIAIECAAVRLAVINGASLAPIEATMAALEKAAHADEFSETVDLELQIHEKICEASGNVYMALIFRTLAGPVRVAIGMDNANYEHIEYVATEHLPLLDAMRAGDAELAARTMHAHIVSTVGPVLERLGGDPAKLLPYSDT